MGGVWSMSDGQRIRHVPCVGDWWDESREANSLGTLAATSSRLFVYFTWLEGEFVVADDTNTDGVKVWPTCAGEFHSESAYAHLVPQQQIECVVANEKYVL